MKFNIRQGKFSASGIHLGVHFGRVSQTYKVRFDSSCLYDDINWERDYNKLMGWSLHNFPMLHQESNNRTPDFKFLGKEYIWGHHIDSVRLVWRANKTSGKIQLGIYYYQDSKLYVVDWIEVPVDTDITLSLTLKSDGDHNGRIIATCVVPNQISEVKTVLLPHPFKAIWSYTLHPYFGGNEPAPHDMTLEVTEI